MFVDADDKLDPQMLSDASGDAGADRKRPCGL